MPYSALFDLGLPRVATYIPPRSLVTDRTPRILAVVGAAVPIARSGGVSYQRPQLSASLEKVASAIASATQTLPDLGVKPCA